jgi:type VI secretion system protein ImpK
MSDPSQPSDPFGRSERTIIRPNPAGRRPSPTPAAPAQPNAPVGYGVPTPPPSYAPPAPPDEWGAPPPGGPQPPPSQRREPPQRALVLKRDVLVAANENPLLRSAGPLLLLLGRLRVALLRGSPAHLMEQVAAAIEDFEKEVRASGVSEHQARVAKYVLCATADDIVQNIPAEDRHVWTQYSMLSRFFGERIGGVRFFQELDRAKQDPVDNYVLLELMHACLALGFQGIHRTSAGGAAMLQQIQRNLYETLRRVRKPASELSPRWQGQALATEAASFQVPVWAVGSLVGVFLLGLYLILRMLLGGNAEAAATAVATVHPTTDLSIQRRVFAPPPPPPPPAAKSTQVKCIQTALAQEIASKALTVEETSNAIIIRVANLVLFASGDATVRDDFKTILQRLVRILEQEQGGIKVIGHTDAAPIRTVRFPSNFHLSVERAKVVSGLLKQSLSNPSRVEIEGKGPDVPLASNESPEGRAKNRRVEILIPRTGAERACAV